MSKFKHGQTMLSKWLNSRIADNLQDDLVGGNGINIKRAGDGVAVERTTNAIRLRPSDLFHLVAKITAVNSDGTLTCSLWSHEDNQALDGYDEVTVATPFLDQPDTITYPDGFTATFTYESSAFYRERVVSFGNREWTEKVVPEYVVGEFIAVLAGPNEFGTLFLDLNHARRSWRVKPWFRVVRQIGTSGTGESEFDDIRGIACNADASTLWVADFGNARIQRFDMETGDFETEWSLSNAPHCLNVSGSSVYVGTTAGIQVYGLGGGTPTTIGSGTIYHAAHDVDNDKIYTSGAKRYSAGGTLEVTATEIPDDPYSVAVIDDRVYVNSQAGVCYVYDLDLEFLYANRISGIVLSVFNDQIYTGTAVYDKDLNLLQRFASNNPLFPLATSTPHASLPVIGTMACAGSPGTGLLRIAAPGNDTIHIYELVETHSQASP